MPNSHAQSQSVLHWPEARTHARYPMQYAPPAYAENSLRLMIDGSDPDRPSGMVRWLDDAGIILIPGMPLDLLQKWDGRIMAAGYIDRLYVHLIADQETLIAEVVGQALPIGYHTLTTRKDLQRGFLSIPRDQAIAGEEYVFPFLLDPDSTFAMLAQDALVSGLAIDMGGRLANGDEPGFTLCGLPLIPESLTVFSAG